MKRTKKMAARMLSMAMSTAWVGAAYGVEAKDPVKVESADGNTTMTLTGTIKVTTLSVTIPTTVTFDIDMTAVPESGDISKVNPQVSQPGPDTYKITNNSASSVWVYVNSVSTEADAGGTAPTLVNEYKTLLTDSYSLMFTIKDAKDDTTPLAVTGTEATGMKIGTEGAGGDWMLSGSKNYFMNSERGKLIAKDQASGVNAGKNEMGLRIYAYTRKGWQAGNSFKVKPVFTVSVTEPATT